MLLGRCGVALGVEEGQGLDQLQPGLAGQDHLVDEAELRGDVGVGELLVVLGHQLSLAGGGIRGAGDGLAVQDVHGALGAHDGDLRGGIGEVEVRADVLAGHTTTE